VVARRRREDQACLEILQEEEPEGNLPGAAGVIIHFVLGEPKRQVDDNGNEEWVLLCKGQEGNKVEDLYFHFDTKENAYKFTRDVNNDMAGLVLGEEEV
jgi:hypothetical protein